MQHFQSYILLITDQHHHVADASPWQLAFLYLAFTLLVIGSSGISPFNLAFEADQFNPNTESGKRGFNSFFNWYFFTFTFAIMVSLTIIVYVQASINWAIGLGIPTFLMFLSCAFFFVGTRIYVVVPPQGSPLNSVVQTTASDRQENIRQSLDTAVRENRKDT
ncbi:hypothetical protein ACS0TY_034675 [Phlomoides rotata]